MKNWTVNSRPVTVADLDPLLRCYVVHVKGSVIGYKRSPDVYEKPSHYGTNRIPWNERAYKAAPPWMTREVIRISSDPCSGTLLEVKEKKK